MAITMRPQDIDEAFPVAGQDNESAGFRDNFTAIKDSLEYTASELNTLTSSTVKLSDANIFDSNASLERIKLVSQSEQTSSTRSAITQASGQEINYDRGAYHSIVLGTIVGGGNNFVLDLNGFPTPAGTEQGRFAKLRLDVILGQGVTVAKTVVFANAGGTLKFDGSWPETLTITSSIYPTVVEFWSYDGGQTIFGRFLGTYGESTRVTSFESITARGNTVLGNNKALDTVKFVSVPQLPVFTSGLQRDTIVKVPGAMIFNLETNSLNICKKSLETINAGNFVVGGRYVITSISGTDFVALGAASSEIGVAFTSTGTGLNNGTGTVSELEWAIIVL